MSSEIEQQSVALDDPADPSHAGAPGDGSRPSTTAREAAPGEWRRLHPSLRRLLGGSGPEPRRIERFLSRNRFPLIARDAVTFIFSGEAEAVYLHHFMRGVPGGLPFERIPDTSLWHLRLPVPKGSRFEYKFDVVEGGHGTWINDPLNPHHATDPYGSNSEGRSYGYSPPPWTEHNPGAPAGRIEQVTIESRVFGESRNVGIYLPAGLADDRRYPAVVLHDGKDFLDHAGLATAFDNLIRTGGLPCFIAVLTQPGERNGEYTGDARHAEFLADEVLPAIRGRFPVREDAEGTVLMGSSLGAVASLATAFSHPGIFGALVLQSGSFILDRSLLEARDPLFERVADFVDVVRGDPARLPRRIFMSCGVYEGLIGQNRILAGFLAQQGIDARFVETRDAHHWRNWRDQLQAALSWTLPGGV